ncbi:MAG: hypothetical protein PHT07_24540, partial [Paludibacter sp.]|nr:hypothetical protein [Paludibacter sp.]
MRSIPGFLVFALLVLVMPRAFADAGTLAVNHCGAGVTYTCQTAPNPSYLLCTANGGGVNNNNCANLVYSYLIEPCSSGTELDIPTGTCKAIVTCTAGQVKNLVVQHGKSQDGFFNLNMKVAGSSGTAIFGGCSYSYTIGTGSECLSNVDLSDATLLYCKVTATNSGNTTSSSIPPNSFLQSDVPVSAKRENDPDGCFTNAEGVKACPIGTTANCAKVNGVDVCAKTPGQGSPVDFGGHTIAELPADGKNCARGTNGKAVCNESPNDGITVQSQKVQLIKDDGTIIALSNLVKEHTFTSSVTNPDGSVTTQTVTENNVIGDSTLRITKTVFADGSEATETTGNAPGTSPNQPEDNGQGDTNVSPGDDSAMDSAFASLE